MTEPRCRPPWRRWAPVGLALVLVCGAAGCSSDGATDSPAAPVTTATVAVSPDASSQDEPESSGPAAEPGVTDTVVRFGQSAAFSGPAAALGNGMRLGIEAAFAQVNAEGGVGGRMLELVSLDDRYEPSGAIANTQMLIAEEQVFALIGAVGTPTSRSAVPLAVEAGIPYLAPFTGAGFLRDTAQSTVVVNLRASYNQETEEMVARLTEDLGFDRIAVMYQDDSFGRAGYFGARAALERRGLEPVSLGLYPRNTTAVKSGLLDVRLGDPEAVIMVGSYAPIAEAIKWARQIGMDATFITISFVGSNALAENLGADGEGVFVTQVVPFPTDDTVGVVADYLDALEAFDADAEPGFVSLEGYLAGRMAIAALERCERYMTRVCLLGAFREGGLYDLDGISLSFTYGDNQGSDEVFITRINEERQHRPVTSLTDASP